MPGPSLSAVAPCLSTNHQQEGQTLISRVGLGLVYKHPGICRQLFLALSQGRNRTELSDRRVGDALMPSLDPIAPGAIHR